MRWSLDSHSTARLIEMERIERRPVARATAGTQAMHGPDHTQPKDGKSRGGEIQVHPNWMTICITVVLVAAVIII